MVSVQEYSLLKKLQPLVLLVPVFFAGSERLIHVFEKANRGGLFLAGGLSVGMALLRKNKFAAPNEDLLQESVNTIFAVAAGGLIAYSATKIFKTSHKLSSKASVRLGFCQGSTAILSSIGLEILAQSIGISNPYKPEPKPFQPEPNPANPLPSQQPPQPPQPPRQPIPLPNAVRKIPFPQELVGRVLNQPHRSNDEMQQHLNRIPPASNNMNVKVELLKQFEAIFPNLEPILSADNVSGENEEITKERLKRIFTGNLNNCSTLDSWSTSYDKDLHNMLSYSLSHLPADAGLRKIVILELAFAFKHCNQRRYNAVSMIYRSLKSGELVEMSFEKAIRLNLHGMRYSLLERVVTRLCWEYKMQNPNAKERNENAVTIRYYIRKIGNDLGIFDPSAQVNLKHDNYAIKSAEWDIKEYFRNSYTTETVFHHIYEQINQPSNFKYLTVAHWFDMKGIKVDPSLYDIDTETWTSKAVIHIMEQVVL